MIQDALRYVWQRGWRVFPVEPGGKRPMTSHGYYDATRDARVIRTWWAHWPDANIGLDIPEGIIILDFDPRNGAPDWRQFPATLTTRTPSGGAHLYFTAPTVGTGWAKELQPGVDIKAGGKGYVLLPPSRTIAGEYTWEMRETEPKPAPQWLVERASRPVKDYEELDPALIGVPRYFPWETGTAYGEGVLRREVQRVLEAENGQRNNTVYTAAMHVAQFVAGGELHPDAVVKVYEAAIKAGLEEEEIRPTIRSAWTAGGATPRRRPK